jgi:hypothetical protein
MEEVMGMDMLKALQDLEENALDASTIEALVVAGFHQLVEVTVHVFHANVKLLAEGIEEYIQCRNKMLMWR